MLVEVAVDGGLKVNDRTEDAALQPTLRQFGEKTFDGVEPRARSRREVESETLMPIEPCAHLRVLVGGVVVEDHMDDHASRDLGLDSVEEADEFLMTMALHVAANDGAVEDVQRREQRRRAVTFVIMRHRSGATFLQRKAGLATVERLNLAFFVDGQDDCMRRRIDVEADDIPQLVDELGIVGEFELAHPMWLKTVGAPDALH